MLILLTGGSANGKSTYAESLLAEMPAPRIYLATMRPYGYGADDKIARHREMRAGKGFLSYDIYTDIGKFSPPENASVLLECMCNLTANEMFDEEGNLTDCEDKLVQDVMKLSSRCKNLIVVTNDVGSDTGDYEELTMRYVTALGRINARLTAEADAAYELVAGIPLSLKCPETSANTTNLPR